jgi:predicted DsbA family dithiol-disulfide isomerase
VRAEGLAEEYELDIDFCAFDLRPGTPPEGIARREAYAGRTYPPGYVDNLLQTAKEAGIEMKRPAIVPNTRKAHEATEFARGHGKLLEFHRAAMHAYWVEERNIGDVEVLCEVAAVCGLDADGLREALADGWYAGEVKEQMEWARSVGVTGIPTTILEDRFALVGAQDYDVFRDVARRVLEKVAGEG